MLNPDQIRTIVDEIRYKDWSFHVGSDLGRLYLQVWFPAKDVASFKNSQQNGRKWWLSEFMVKSEVVQTALKAVLTAEEHEAREQFKYAGKAVFNPHINVDSLALVCDNLEYRGQ